MSKVVLVTGASSGFGKFTALELIKRGYIVYGAARRFEQMTDIVEAGGYALKMDVTNDISVSEGIEKIISEKGRIDVLINNAGYAAYDFVENADIVQMQNMFDVNYWGLVRVSQAVIPFMRQNKRGTIVNISSVVGKISTAFLGFYASSKHAVEAISDAMRQELTRFGINVSIIEPGVFSTGFDDVVLDQMKELKPDKAYEPVLDKFVPFFKEMYEKAPTPEPVVKAILKVIEAKKPKPRVSVGSDAKLGLFVKGKISDRAFDKIMMSRMNLKEY